ncbi:MAG: TonB-dependent receptor [Nitrosomonas oligotropha]|uniref:TonB-dependent receptor n=1 Tax=Nitrosomonas oligotropha TaxID=42354 RepID=A0A5C7W0V3_9PROT|nr:MAG: TonB-dependent receptor [Nitrosomonas oligotropha]
MITINKITLCYRAVLINFVLFLGFVSSINSYAQSAQQPVEIHIAAQPLGRAITQLAAQTGILIGVDASLITDKQAPAINGRYTIEQAIKELLAGSGLVAVNNAPGRYAIEAAPANHPTDSDARTAIFPEIKVRSTTRNADANYAVPRSSTATKTDTPIMATPVSIQVIPKSVIKDQQAVDAREVMQNISGVQQSTSSANYENFVIRGFDANGSVYRNGLRQDSFAEEISHLERIEVLKGPASVLYGRAEPGGLINLVSLQPLDQPYFSLQQQVGSYGFYRTTVDATGPINADRSLRYRFNLAYRNSDSFRDLIFQDRIFVNPQITWQITPRTVVNASFEHQRDNFLGDYGFPAVGNRPLQAPVNRSFSDPAAFDAQISNRGFLNWSHAFNDDWKVTHRFMTGNTDYTQFDLLTLPPKIGQTIFDRRLWGVHQDRDIYSTNIDLNGNFNTWGIKHSVLFGFDYYRINQLAVGHCCSLAGPISTVDSQDPVYGVITRDELKSQPQDYHFVLNQEWKGMYFQDQITLWDKLHILGGGRYDWLEVANGFSATSVAEANASAKTGRISEQRFSPRVGVLYQPWQWLSTYGNYTESIGANNGRTSNNQPLDPQTARQFEVGFKTAFFEERLMSTLAFFHITKNNLQAPNLATADPFDVAAIGEARSRGIEIDISGQLTEAWQIIATYAYTDTRITKDASCDLEDENTNFCLQSGLGNTSHRLPNAAPHSGSLWTKYDFKQGILRGLSLGTGVFVVGKRQGNVTNDFQLPGYARWDASAARLWKFGPTLLTAQVNVRNILDNGYFVGANTYDGSPSGYGNIPGAPLTVLGSLRLEY